MIIKNTKIKQNKKINKLQIFLGFFVGFLLAIGLFFLSQKTKPSRPKGPIVEVEFSAPGQALIFWKTEKLTTGYVLYGERSDDLSMAAYPTNNKASQIHTVVINDIPKKGIYFIIYSEGERIDEKGEPFKAREKS